MILSDLFCCWPSGRGIPSEKIVADAADAKQQPAISELCVFCNPTPDKFNIILESDKYVVFADRSPAARHHLLAVPRTHIPNVKSLSGVRGAQIVDELQHIGRQALDIVSRGDVLHTIDPFADKDIQQAPTASASSSFTGPASRVSTTEPRETRYGFHIPPARSVDHLHLHCLVLPFASPLKAVKYRVALGDGSATAPHKGWGWFVTAEQASAILRDGGQVGIRPC